MPSGESMLTSLRSNKRKNVNDSFFKNGFTTIKDRKQGILITKKQARKCFKK